MNKKLTLVFLCILFNFQFVNAQKQTSQWYFSNNSALDFLSGAPIALTNSAMNQYEGSSCISDDNGSLLFYTNGTEVWDATHSIMPNGTGLNGNNSTNQSALIVPKPNSNTEYYVFTNDMSNLYYSVVDITLNGGLGAVTTKNIFLQGSISEKLAGVKHANGIDVWVMVHGAGNSTFYAFLVTPLSVAGTPVISTGGPIDPGTIGQMHFSPNGKFVAFSSYGGAQNAAIFEFDNATGLASNGIGVPFSNQIYGCCFSPNSRYFYHQSNPPPCGVYQLDLQAGNAAAILASSTQVGTGLSTNLGHMQIGYDKKIYLAHDGLQQLAVINYPDSPAAAVDYNNLGVTLAGKTCGLGLPNFLASYFNDNVLIKNFCFGDSTTFSIEDTSALALAQWTFDDPSSGPANVVTQYNTYHIFTAPGTYNVELIRVYNNALIDTAYYVVNIVTAPIINLGADTTLCIGQNIVLNAGSGSSFTWQNGSTLSTYTATVTGTYYVNVANIQGCVGNDSIDVTFTTCAGPVAALASSDTLWCDKTCIDFFDLSLNNPTSWTWYFQGASPSTSTDQNPTGICYNNYGSFDVTLVACNALSCDSLYLDDFVTEFQLPAPSVVTFSNDTLYSTPAFSYQWYNTNNINLVLGTLNYFVPVVDGSYFVLTSDSNGCSVPSNTVGFYTGINNISHSQQFTLSPNPANNILQITTEQTGTYQCSIIDYTGRQVMNFQSPAQIQKVDISKLSKGIYSVLITTNNQVVQLSFVKQ